MKQYIVELRPPKKGERYLLGASILTAVSDHKHDKPLDKPVIVGEQ